MIPQVRVDLGRNKENCWLGEKLLPRPSLTHAARGDALGSSNKSFFEHPLCANHLAPGTLLSLQHHPIHR